MGFVLVHPNLGGAQGISLGVVIDVVVVGLLGALDVRHPGAGQDLHAAATLPHLDKRGNGTQKAFNVLGACPQRCHSSTKFQDVVNTEGFYFSSNVLSCQKGRVDLECPTETNPSEDTNQC